MREQQPLSVLFYVQHLLGIGHLMRARRIAIALRDDNVSVTLVTGGMPLPEFELPGIQHIALPAMAVSGADFSELVDAAGKPIDDTFRQQRRDMLLNCLSSVKPDIVLTEAFPFGRRQVRFELLPLIAAIEDTLPKPMLLASIRDILQVRNKPGRDEETVALVQKHYDKVLVHGDPAFAPLASSFALAEEIADQIIYTGLISGPAPAAVQDQFTIIVSAGGGAVGEKLLSAVIEASTHLPEIYTWCVITGPNLPERDFAALVDSAPSNVTVEKFRSDFTSLLMNARLSISQAGYNTVSDVLQANCRALLVPFSSGGETEQLARASRLQEMGLATVVLDNELSGPPLASAIEATLSQSLPAKQVSINVDGASQTGRILRELVGQ